MDSGEVDEVRSEVDALARALSEERFRNVAGLAPEPRLASVFDAHGLAAHRDTVAMLREVGEKDLAARVAELAGERAAAPSEDAWRAADAAATGNGPDGPVGIADAGLALLHERDRERRRALGRAVAEASLAASLPREAAAEERAAARAALGLTPAWEDVVQADELLAVSEGAYQDVLAWFARHEGLELPPRGDLDRTALLHLLAFRDHDGLFRPAPLSPAVLDGFDGLGVDVRRVRLDGAARAGKWAGAHAFEGRVSLRRQGGLSDWLDLPDAAGRAAAAATSRPSTRDPALPATVGALGAWLLLEPRFLESATGQDRRRSRDVIRRLALRLLFQLRARAGALRVAVEVERGTGGRAWHEAHREALSRATLAGWPDGLAARDADAGALRASLAGAAWAAVIRQDLKERFDEDYWRNPRTGEA
ncbi:MAG: hypothetical protein RJA59_2139, partial [Pseudomonadota bacterium]